jgi:hypothetical protein
MKEISISSGLGKNSRTHIKHREKMEATNFVKQIVFRQYVSFDSDRVMIPLMSLIVS